MGRPPKVKEVIKKDAINLPEIGKYYLSGIETRAGIDKDNNLFTILSVSYLPVEEIIQHGKEYRILFDHAKTKGHSVSIPCNMMLKINEVSLKLRMLADMIDGKNK